MYPWFPPSLSGSLTHTPLLRKVEHAELNIVGGLLITLHSVDVSQVTAKSIYRLMHVYLRISFSQDSSATLQTSPDIRTYPEKQLIADYRAILLAEETVMLPNQPMPCGRATGCVAVIAPQNKKLNPVPPAQKKYFSPRNALSITQDLI